MLKKIHIRFTLLFTVISTLILTVMSVFYVYFNYQSLYKNAMMSFQSDINTFTSDFEKNTSVSYEWLIKMESNYHYSFYLYDNNVPFQFTNDTKTEAEKIFIKNLKEYYQKKYGSNTEKTYNTVHQEFKYSFEKKRYYASVITVGGKKSNSQIYVVYSLDIIKQQLHGLYIKFSAIIFISAVALFIFSWIFTGHLLKPVMENHKKQMQFISAASHEIRNPVNTILSALNAMGKCSEERRLEFVEIARKEGKRLSLLTDDLLTLARSDNQSFIVSFGKSELDTLVLECYEAFLLTAREKKINLSAQLPDYPLIANNIDRERIKQVLAILLDNAISYTGENGKIVICCTETSKTFIIEVIDNGIGVDDRDKQSVFERFYRADISRENKNHFGLGLCIAKEIMDMHHGSIFVKDTIGGGATFVVTILK